MVISSWTLKRPLSYKDGFHCGERRSQFAGQKSVEKRPRIGGFQNTGLIKTGSGRRHLSVRSYFELCTFLSLRCMIKCEGALIDNHLSLCTFWYQACEVMKLEKFILHIRGRGRNDKKMVNLGASDADRWCDLMSSSIWKNEKKGWANAQCQWMLPVVVLVEKGWKIGSA